MTPKEKAIYLYIMYKQRTSYTEVFHTQELLDKFHDNAKRCALIAVDEIINTGPLKMIDWGGIISDKPYWKEVKQEIEAL